MSLSKSELAKLKKDDLIKVVLDQQTAIEELTEVIGSDDKVKAYSETLKVEAEKAAKEGVKGELDELIEQNEKLQSDFDLADSKAVELADKLDAAEESLDQAKNELAAQKALNDDLKKAVKELTEDANARELAGDMNAVFVKHEDYPDRRFQALLPKYRVKGGRVIPREDLVKEPEVIKFLIESQSPSLKEIVTN